MLDKLDPEVVKMLMTRKRAPKRPSDVHMDEIMEEKDSEMYLGDVIAKDGKNIENIKARVNKGTGIVITILTMLDGIPFGNFFLKLM